MRGTRVPHHAGFTVDVTAARWAGTLQSGRNSPGRSTGHGGTRYDPMAMLDAIRGVASDRKLRLFALALGRRLRFTPDSVEDGARLFGGGESQCTIRTPFVCSSSALWRA
jgi:hypothetical protein